MTRRSGTSRVLLFTVFFIFYARLNVRAWLSIRCRWTVVYTVLYRCSYISIRCFMYNATINLECNTGTTLIWVCSHTDAPQWVSAAPYSWNYNSTHSFIHQPRQGFIHFEITLLILLYSNSQEAVVLRSLPEVILHHKNIPLQNKSIWAQSIKLKVLVMLNKMLFYWIKYI